MCVCTRVCMLLCVCMCVSVCTVAYIWRSEDKLWDSVLFLLCGLRNWTQDIRLASAFTHCVASPARWLSSSSSSSSFTCMYVCAAHACLWKSEEGVQYPGTRARMWVLITEFRSSSRASNAPNYWAISLAPDFLFNWRSLIGSVSIRAHTKGRERETCWCQKGSFS